MGYYVKKLPSKKTEPKWKIQFVSYKKEHVKELRNSQSKKPKKTWDIDRDRWKSLGFYKYMDIDEARIRCKQLNIQVELKSQEEYFIRQKEKEEEFQKRFDSVLPKEFVDEFEKRFLYKRDLGFDDNKRSLSKPRTVWKAAQKMIVAVGLEPSDWFYSHYDLYDYLYQQQYSIRYGLAILKVANLWGFFFCKKTGRAFLPVPPPRGYERQRLIECYYSKSVNGRRASKPLLPKKLNREKYNMLESNFNWLYLTVWFGLRPKEVDNSKNDELWKIERCSNGLVILWIFQTKLIALPREERWKPIPILYDEQKFALRILEGQNFKRPLVKTIHRYFGKGIDLYGGRKGFTDLMLSKGNGIENISTWMGHSTLDRTWRSYKQRRKFHLASSA
jgi:hypothetical protein